MGIRGGEQGRRMEPRSLDSRTREVTVDSCDVINPGQRWRSTKGGEPDVIVQGKSALLWGWWTVRTESGRAWSIEGRQLLRDYRRLTSEAALEATA